MGFSPLAAMDRRIPDVGRSQPRDADVAGVLAHHNAGVDAFGQATAPGREVSANYWITNGGALLPNVDESRRAFTSGAWGYPEGALADHRFITVEVSNSPEGVASGSWAISAAAQATLERLIGDVHARYNLGVVKRGFYSGVAVHRDFVPTECPGGYIMDHLPEIIVNAEAYRTGGIPAPTDKENPVDYITRDTNKRKANQTVGKTALYLQFEEGQSALTTRPGDHVLTDEVRLSGKAGTVVRLTAYRYIWDAQRKAYSSEVYLNGERVELDEHGFAEVSIPISNRVPADGSRIGLKAQVLHGSGVEVTRHAVKGHRWDL